MNVFDCDGCGALVFFENVSCLQCGHVLGFLPDVMEMAALEPAADQRWSSRSAASQGRLYRPCANGVNFGVCNWYVPADEPDELCVACRLNAVVPDATVPAQRALWHKMEVAKRRLIYTLRQWSLPTAPFPGTPGGGLQFRFLADDPAQPPVLTGHHHGVITVNLAEADDAERERRRTELHEPQRTLVGHFRHESGHFYWDTLIDGTPDLEPFRALFGDERADYAEALQRHYANGPAPDWAARCVSAYASVHPWEDWAETWGHYFQMVDALETAAGVGLVLRPRRKAAKVLKSDPVDPTFALADPDGFDALLRNWLSLTCALNSLNRGAGLPDLYPYVLSTPAVEKLHFVHDLIARTALRSPEPAAQPPATESAAVTAGVAAGA